MAQRRRVVELHHKQWETRRKCMQMHLRECNHICVCVCGCLSDIREVILCDATFLFEGRESKWGYSERSSLPFPFYCFRRQGYVAGSRQINSYGLPPYSALALKNGLMAICFETGRCSLPPSTREHRLHCKSPSQAETSGSGTRFKVAARRVRGENRRDIQKTVILTPMWLFPQTLWYEAVPLIMRSHTSPLNYGRRNTTAEVAFVSQKGHFDSPFLPDQSLNPAISLPVEFGFPLSPTDSRQGHAAALMAVIHHFKWNVHFQPGC